MVKSPGVGLASRIARAALACPERQGRTTLPMRSEILADRLGQSERIGVSTTGIASEGGAKPIPGTPQKSFICAPVPLDTRNPWHRRGLKVAR
jgi:hypothetical protein